MTSSRKKRANEKKQTLIRDMRNKDINSVDAGM